jgi:hypothetical protein
MPAGDREKARSAVAKIIRAALVALVLVSVAPDAAVALDRGRVAIAFLPGLPPKTKPPLVSRIASYPSVSFGFASAIQGSYRPEQTLLDMSAGSRVWTSLYKHKLPKHIALRPDGSEWSVSHWRRIRDRAKSPPADIVPGLLEQTLGQAGLSTAFVGIEGRSNRESLLATDEGGRVLGVTLARTADVGRAAVKQWRTTSLLVARLPGGREGSSAIAELLKARRPGDLVIIVERPSFIRRRLLAVGVVGLTGGTNVRSETTRTDGLISATDIAPTVLKHLGLPVPKKMAGEPVRARGNHSPQELTDFKDRLAEVGPRRWLIVLAGLTGAILLGGVASVFTGDRLARFRRAAFLAAVWLPSVLLATGAIAPSRLGEVVLTAGACALLAVATDRLLPWPRGIALPAAVAIIAHVIDLAFGSSLIQRSLLGPNPILGARFFGVGNELEVTLGVIGLLGIGALFASASRRRLAGAFLIGGAFIAMMFSWGKLGADVGASLMLAAGGTAAAVVALGKISVKRGIALVIAAPVIALAALAVLDTLSGGNGHFTRSVLNAGGLGNLADIAQRRVELSYRSLTRGVIAPLVLVAISGLVWGIRSRTRLLGRLESAPGLQAGLVGAFVAVVVGALSNDSGPMILLIGTSYLGLAVGYLKLAPKRGAN